MEEQESFERIPGDSYGTEYVENMEHHDAPQEIVASENMGPTKSDSPHANTYIEIISEKDESGQPLSVLEVDLVISREKGRETRRLEMNFAGIDVEKKQMIEKSVSIDRQNFEILKNFFCNLDWNS
jgi:hypothetical protein